MSLCHAWTAPGTNATIFPVKHKGPTAKEGLGLSNNWFFSSDAKPNSWKRMLVQTEPNSQFFQVSTPKPLPSPPSPCTSFNMKCSMCPKRKHFGKRKHLANANIKDKEIQYKIYKIIAKGLFSLSFYIQFTLCYTKTPYCIEATASKVRTINIGQENHSYSIDLSLSTATEVVCMKWLIGPIPFWNYTKSNCWDTPTSS